MTSVLEQICAKKRDHVAAQKSLVPLVELKARLKDASSPRGFANALRARAAQNQPGLIAEIKRASPSVGIIRADFDPPSLAQAYESGGATCLSVLTDIPYFQGQDADLMVARAACSLPVLRKDFMIDDYQLYEARALSADCILLIMAALTNDEARKFYDQACELGMDVLVEIHDHDELDRAIALGADLIGVNSRNLKTLEVDLQTAHDLAPHIPATALKIAESGIAGSSVRIELQQAGYQAFLVGESLMRQADVAKATKKFLE